MLRSKGSLYQPCVVARPHQAPFARVERLEDKRGLRLSTLGRISEGDAHLYERARSQQNRELRAEEGVTCVDPLRGLR